MSEESLEKGQVTIEKTIEINSETGNYIAESDDGTHFAMHEVKAQDSYIFDNEEPPWSSLFEGEGQSLVSETTNQLLPFLSSLFTLVIIVPLIIAVIQAFFRIATEGVSIPQRGNPKESTEKETYKQAYSKVRRAINYFKPYRNFYQKIKWFAFKNRKNYSEELAELFQVFMESPYKKNPFYQHEIIQLFSKIDFKYLLKENVRKQLISQIQYLNETFWDIEF